jgi:hypothetical protein
LSWRNREINTKQKTKKLKKCIDQCLRVPEKGDSEGTKNFLEAKVVMEVMVQLMEKLERMERMAKMVA